jgi:hypothetical protein
MDTFNHGTYATYTNRNCRCDLCKKAASEYAKAKKLKGLPEGDKRHGTRNGYFNWGCRCDDCKLIGKEYASSRPDGARSASLKRNYGLTSEDWDELFESQEGLCASCGEPPAKDAKRRFHLDHNHITGQNRGILCHGCNVALGLLKEDRTKIRALIDYLNKWDDDYF